MLILPQGGCRYNELISNHGPTAAIGCSGTPRSAETEVEYTISIGSSVPVWPTSTRHDLRPVLESDLGGGSLSNVNPFEIVSARARKSPDEHQGGRSCEHEWQKS